MNKVFFYGEIEPLSTDFYNEEHQNYISFDVANKKILVNGKTPLTAREARKLVMDDENGFPMSKVDYILGIIDEMFPDRQLVEVS
jgi:hypothetical protein